MIVLTGGAGFIGSAMLSRLNEAGYENIIVVDSLKSSSKWKNLQGKVFNDYLDKADLFSYLAHFDTVEAIIHMGACSSTTEMNADYLMDNNFKYSRRLAEWALEKGARFIYASSAATYGDGSNDYSDESVFGLRPLNMYGYSKQLMDEYVYRNRLETRLAGFKFFNVYGPNEYHKGSMKSVVYKSYHQIIAKGSVELFKSYHMDYSDGEQKRDFIYVKDVVEVLYKFLTKPEWNGIFNLGTGEARSWNDLVKAVFKALDLPAKINYIDMPDNLRGKYQYFTQANTEKLLSLTGYKMTSLEEGVRDYVINYLLKEDGNL